MRTFGSVDELAAAVGTHLGRSQWQEVTQGQIDLFADATGDHQWIHVDPDRAAAGPFGKTVAHGYLTLSLVPLMVQKVYKVEGLALALNYGANKVRFPAAVPVGSVVRAGVELVSVEPASMGFLVATKVTVELQGSEKPACVAETLTLVVPTSRF
jgi:acyl dehydratase